MSDKEIQLNKEVTKAEEIDRRSFLKTAVGAVAGAAIVVKSGVEAQAAEAISQTTPEKTRHANRINEMLNLKTPMNKWKYPQSLEFVEAATKRYSFPNWQSGNEDSIYYNMNLPEFFKSCVVPAPENTSTIKRDLNPDLLDVKFTAFDGTTTPTLKKYLGGKRQVQAMMMAHKGKVVFETYPGMNPNGIHIWMSAAKTTVGLLVSMLAQEGKIDLEKPLPTYVPSLKGSAWEKVSVKNAMNMSSGLDIEETIKNLLNPESWIANFFTAAFEGKGSWQAMARDAQPLANEPAGAHFRYSGANTMMLLLATQHVTGMRWEQYWNERVWSKIGAKGQFICGLAEGVPIGAGLHSCTPEDFLRYALLYTPSWNVVAKEQVISDELLKAIQGLGDPKAYRGSTEEQYGSDWFGEVPEKNTAQWDHAFSDGAMFKHGNMGQGIYVDPKRDFCGIYFGLAPNQDEISGIDHSPGYLRAAAKMLAGK